ncbi:hypothetical protein [Noviluteimonas gilva]|nr:hypothetical protein [Lysobacter gilvus]
MTHDVAPMASAATPIATHAQAGMTNGSHSATTAPPTKAAAMPALPT